MKNDLQLVRTDNFNGIDFDCYQDSGREFWGTREQIGQLLDYENPRISIANIHNRNKERLDKFSSVINLITEAGIRETMVYNFKGLLEICRYSNQPKANAVMDFLWEIADEIRKTGEYNTKDDLPKVMAWRVKAIQRMLEKTDYELTKAEKRVLTSKLAFMLTGEEIVKNHADVSDEEIFLMRGGVSARIVEYLKSEGVSSLHDIVKSLNLNYNSARELLRRMVKKGIVGKVRHGIFAIQRQELM